MSNPPSVESYLAQYTTAKQDQTNETRANTLDPYIHKSALPQRNHFTRATGLATHNPPVLTPAETLAYTSGANDSHQGGIGRLPMPGDWADFNDALARGDSNRLRGVITTEMCAAGPPRPQMEQQDQVSHAPNRADGAGSISQQEHRVNEEGNRRQRQGRPAVLQTQQALPSQSSNSDGHGISHNKALPPLPISPSLPSHQTNNPRRAAHDLGMGPQPPTRAPQSFTSRTEDTQPRRKRDISSPRMSPRANRPPLGFFAKLKLCSPFKFGREKRARSRGRSQTRSNKTSVANMDNQTRRRGRAQQNQAIELEQQRRDRRARADMPRQYHSPGTRYPTRYSQRRERSVPMPQPHSQLYVTITKDNSISRPPIRARPRGARPMPIPHREPSPPPPMPPVPAHFAQHVAAVVKTTPLVVESTKPRSRPPQPQLRLPSRLPRRGVSSSQTTTTTTQPQSRSHDVHSQSINRPSRLPTTSASTRGNQAYQHLHSEKRPAITTTTIPSRLPRPSSSGTHTPGDAGTVMSSGRSSRRDAGATDDIIANTTPPASNRKYDTLLSPETMRQNVEVQGIWDSIEAQTNRL